MKEHLFVNGGRPLNGTVNVSGAKNAALPILIATLLSRSPCEISNVPALEDISVTVRLLRRMGTAARFEAGVVYSCAERLLGAEAPVALVKSMRASFWVLGPLLARLGEARVALPGGDAIGNRPVDLHLQGLVRMGADIRIEHGTVIAAAPGGLRPAMIDLDYPSVGATHQLLMAAAGTEGESVISGAAREPEVVELADFLSRMGAEIDGAGTPRIVVRGKRELGGAKWKVLGDRIEATTYLAAGAATGGAVTVEGISATAMEPVLKIFAEAGCHIKLDGDSISLEAPPRLCGVSFETNPFPGFPTDAQPLLLAALAGADGVSKITETVFENRFSHVLEYRKFGAQIAVSGRLATITGVDNLHGAAAGGGDIRAVAGLVIIALAAQGESELFELHHLDRGYEKLVEKFCALGAQIERTPSRESADLLMGC